ncbi:MAG: MscL family protein [Thermoplasmata archaeon]|nr:MscL family protein [Thermoplasmata archaeon]
MSDVNTEMLEEMKKIRELLTPKPAAEGRTGMVGEFLDFVGKYKILGLAVAFVIGMYLGEVVKGLVTGLLMPLITAILEPMMGGDSLVGSFEPYKPGLFIMALITFAIVCLVVFIVMKVAKKWNVE